MRLISKKYLVIFAVLILGLVFLNVLPGVSKFSGNLIFKIFSPLQKLSIRTGNKITGFFELLISIKNLEEENAELKQINLELESSLTRLKEVERENQILKEGLNFSKNNIKIYEMALVVGKSPQGDQDWILINKGGNQNIEKNMPIISSEMSLAGKIVAVEPNFSKAILIRNKESIVAALIETERSEGLVKRDENGKLYMDFIPKEEKLEIGNKIITSGMDNIYPKGILIGKIESIDISENQIFQKVIISPAINFSKLEEVFIIK